MATNFSQGVSDQDPQRVCILQVIEVVSSFLYRGRF
jgi:hypothetical protein